MEYFPNDCLMKFDLVPISSPNTSLKYIGIIPSPHKDEGEIDRCSLNEIIRSKSCKDVARTHESYQG